MKAKSGRKAATGTIGKTAFITGTSLVALAVSGGLSPAAAQTWDGSTSNDWTVGTNWSTNTAPTNGTVTINTETPNPVVIGVSGPVVATSGLLLMGTVAGTSSLTIQNGSALTSTTAGANQIGQSSSGVNATVTVTGLGSAWSTAASTILGNGFTGTGTLNILDRASAGLASLTVGQNGGGSGVVNVTGAGVLTVTGNATMFRRTGSSTANISGTGSQWNVGGTLAVGTGQTSASSGIGAVNIDNGAAVSVGGAITIGGVSFSTTGNGAVTVTGAGSQFSGGGALNVGQWGLGTLTVSDGAVATVGTVTLGGGSTGNGTLNLSSGGLLATQALTGAVGVARQVNFDGGTLRATASNAAFVSGFSGTELNIAAGGLTLDTGSFDVTAASPFTGAGALTKIGSGTAVLSGSSSYTGGTTISGGTLQITSDANLGDAAGSLTFDNGTLQVRAPVTSSRALVIAAGNGTINVDTSVDASTSWTVGGTITGPGSLTKTGLGRLILTGDATHAGTTTVSQGVLQIGNGGTTGSIAGDIVNNGNGLSFNRSDSYSYGGSITGTGPVGVASGIVTLTGNSNIGGNITVDAGAELRVTAGNTVSTTASVITTRATTTVSGPGSTLQAQLVSAVAGLGTDALIRVENGGVIRTTGTTAMQLRTQTGTGAANLEITGAGSLVDLGNGQIQVATATGSTSAITISDGGVLRTGTLATIGALAGNTTASTVTITGAGSSWTGTGVLLQRNGQFSVLDGAAASFNSANIGSIAQGASMLVSGAGSTFTTTGLMSVGTTTGTGALTIAEGAQVTAGSGLSIAEDAGTTGVVNIGGAEGQAAVAAGVLNATTLAFGPGTGRLNFNHTDTNYGFATAVSGTGTILHWAGVTSLTGDSSAFGGQTAISGGTLLVNGTLGNAASGVQVLGGGTLGGSGTIGGDVFVGGGAVLAPGNSPGTLTVNGDLGFSPNATLAYEFGQANVPGGPLNDLVDVGGDLVLDGTINVTQSAGGTFGPGVFRIINYAGTLTDNGLSVGTMPAGSETFVQTVVPGQVNLVNTAGLTLNFWDGAAGPKNDGAIQGGSGTWRLGGGENNWTEMFGAVNADYAQDSFAIFSGTGGTVTVDNGNGNVRAAGMQFAVDGYTLTGGSLELTGTDAFVRVGAGSAGDAAITATIASALTGSARLVKDMGGTLVLTGTNSYTGGTAINGGTLRVSSDANLGAASGGLSFNGGTLHTTGPFSSSRAVDLAGTGTFFTDAGLVLSGGIAGTGALVKDGAAILELTADNSYTGGTTINSGMLRLGDGGATGSITGNVVNNAQFAINRSNTLTLAGTISGSGELLQMGTGTTILTAANDYAGATRVAGGMLLINGNQSAATGLTAVAANATLGGTGTIGGNVLLDDGTLAPGAGGAGALTINGNLSMGAGARLAYDFGAANAPGSALNDVVNVGGDLTLDGTLNVAVTPGGAFGIGLYRVLNYGGTLTDNGLAIGTMPTGSDVFVQTAVANQVNLINTGGATLNFWDGSAAANKFNNVVDGGSGMWRTGLDNSWTEATGAVNAGYANGAFAIFAGTGGLVTIDNSLGTVTASGLQFATTNYRIQGDALTLTGPQSVIRVGDGTTAGLGYSTIITAEITGGAQLVKTDIGRLELTGTNSYTGGTAVNGGTVRISSDANLGAASGGLSFNGGTLNTTADISTARAVTLAGQGVFSVDTGTTLTLSGSLSGTGLIGKLDAGTLVLAGTGNHTGGMGIVQGTLLVNGNYAAATGPITINQIATLGGTGTIGGDVNLRGTLAPGAGGTGTLTINGDLTISQTATLSYEFGQANVAGGALNDLVNIGGNLTLDGTINVTVPAGGAFDAGIYRVFNYGGALTNNGLSLGSLPAGSNVSVQTSIAGQVNLVNFAGLTLNFWDGAAGPRNNGVVNGGTGIWQSSGGNDNWTEAAGLLNAGYSDGAFAVFGGTGGTVTVDNSLGQVTAGGMQFATGGYTITGGGIALTGPQSVIRVGDGSTAGAGYTATINAALSGASELVKTDAGTLVLGGTNSYTGGTRINGGTVQIASDANLGAASGAVTFDGGTLATSANVTSARNIVMTGAGTISAASGTTFTLSGLLSGTGALTNGGAGTLLMTGDNSGFAGSTRVEGTMIVNGSLCGDINVAVGGRLGGTGTVCTTVNAGTVAPGNSIGTLTVAGTYTGNNGVLEIETELGGDASPTDRLVVTQGTAGSTEMVVTNRGGLGAQTVEGIKIIDVTGGTSAGTFTLRGDYSFEGSPAVIAGAYGYRLFQGGVSTPTDGDWYLRSALLDAPNEPQAPLYQPGVPLYESYAATLQRLNRLGTLQERVGNRQWSGFTQGGVGMWGRMEGARYRPEAVFSTSGSDLDVNDWSLQAGFDKALLDTSAGTLIAGINGRYGKADGSVRSRFGNGKIDTRGYGAGATLTWYDATGFYADAQAQMSWYRSDLKSTVLGTLVDDNHGSGEAFSLELGKHAPLGGGLSVTPQIQMTYSNVRFDAFTDPNDAAVAADKGDSLRSRWGISLDHQKSWDGGSGARSSHVYGIVNLSYEWLDGSVVDVSGTPIARRDARLWGEVGLGGSYSWADGRFTIFSEVSANTAINNFGDSNTLRGNAGFRMRF